MKYLYNASESPKTYVGIEIPVEEYLQIPYNLEAKFSNTSQLLIDIASGDIVVSKTDDSDGHITDVNTAINHLKDNLSKDVSITSMSASQLPFAAKILPDGSKIYRRVRGTTGVVQNTTDNIDFMVPFAKCKITGLQILNGKIGDKATFKILDTAAGTVSGTPYAVLNTFGQDVNIIPDVAEYPSKYDADLFYGLILRIEYDPIDELLPRTIYVNYDLHEVVTS